MDVERAIQIAELWGCGKMIGADEDEVIAALLDEVKRLRFENAGRPFVTYDQNRAGWCVWKSSGDGVSAFMAAGPFATREEAEALLGPPAPPMLEQTA